MSESESAADAPASEVPVNRGELPVRPADSPKYFFHLGAYRLEHLSHRGRARHPPPGAEGLKLSVVIPAQNEEGSVGATVEGVVAVLERVAIDYEVVVVNDDSEDSTEAVVAAIAEGNPRVRVHRSHHERGFGNAIRAGLDVYSGDAVAIVMADASDNPEDLVRYHQLLEESTSTSPSRCR